MKAKGCNRYIIGQRQNESCLPCWFFLSCRRAWLYACCVFQTI